MAIIGIALGVGAIVYALSLRTGAEQVVPFDTGDEPPGPVTEARRPQTRTRRGGSLGFGTAPLTPDDAEGGAFVYVPVLAGPGPGWRRRLAGLVGLIAMVLLGSMALAIAIYQMGHMLNQTIERFLGH